MNAFSRRTILGTAGVAVLLAGATLFAGSTCSYADDPATSAKTPTSQPALPPSQPALPPSPIAQAKTIQVIETVSTAGPGGQLTPTESFTVQIARPDKVRIDMKRAAGPGKPLSDYGFGITNGTSKHEYQGIAHEYMTGQNDLENMANSDLILHPDQASFSGVPATLSRDILDGKPMIVRSQTVSGQDEQGPIKMTEKVWFDAGTGLPYRKASYFTKKGTTTLSEQVDFSNWVFDQPIDAARFAWAPPAGSKEYVEPKLLAKGAKAPDFAAQTADGKIVHLSDFKGKPVVIDFWSTWCGPCQASMPHLERVYQQIRNKNVAVLAVCVWDDKDAYQKWVKANIGTKYHFPTAFDPAGRDNSKSIATHLFGVSGIPTQYVIDKNGRVAANNVGYSPGDTALEAGLAQVGVIVKVASAK